MDAWNTFVHMFDALDHDYDTSHNQVIGNYLSSLNPFLFAGKGSADPAEYIEFKRDFFEAFPDGEAAPAAAYAFCKQRIECTAPAEVITAFLKVTQDEWVDAWNHREDSQ